ncbi:unnamed protein product, partial [Polarella glacialis]
SGALHANGGLSPGSHRGGNAWENSATMQDQMEELENRCRKAEEVLEESTMKLDSCRSELEGCQTELEDARMQQLQNQ